MNAEDVRGIISSAIDTEIEAYNFYHGVAGKAHDPSLKKIFDELASEETKHRKFLEGFLGKGVANFHFEATKDYKVGDNLPTPPLTDDLKPLEGLVIAIKKELQAMQMYTQLANLSSDTEQELLFFELANMEKTHKARLEDLYTEMSFPEVW